MKNHLQQLSFCNIRRLNPFQTYEENILGDWAKKRTWHELSAVNIFIGANGAGKSTVLELVDLLRNPRRVITLARENQNRHSITACHLIFGRGDDVRVIVHPYKREGTPLASNLGRKTDPVDIQALELHIRTALNKSHELRRNISKIELDSEVA